MHIGVGVVLQPEAPRAWAAALWEPESRAERVTTYRSSAPQSNASRYWMGEGQEDWGAVALSFIRQSRAPWSRRHRLPRYAHPPGWSAGR